MKNRQIEIDELLSASAKDIQRARLIFHDDKSVDVYNAKLNSNFHCRHSTLENLLENRQYFPADIIKLHDHEVFVDCGALDGYTATCFALEVNGEYDHIFSFEPHPESYKFTKMRLKFASIRDCTVYQLGVLDRDGEVFIADNGIVSGSRISDSGVTKVNVISLDSCLFESKHYPTFIKMDIEGAELNALIGAKRIIARNHPKLAISVYHNDKDIWEIPLWIKDNFPSYRIFLRQHSNVYETVCYAI